jgi:hypothetical protein
MPPSALRHVTAWFTGDLHRYNSQRTITLLFGEQR